MKQKKDKNITDPHDSFIKKVLKSKEDAKSLIKGVLPEEIKQIIRLETIRLQPDSFVDASLKKSFSDIVYQVDGLSNMRFNVSFIIEHKSFVPKVNIKLQLIQYFIGATLTQVQQNIMPPALPIIILLYDGNKDWQNEPLWTVFGDVPEIFRPFIPDFEFIQVDFNDYDDEKIKHVFDSYKIRATVMLMRDIHKNLEFVKTFQALLEEISKRLPETGAVEYLKLMLYYLQNYSEGKYREAENVIKEISTKKNGTMNIVDELIEKGIAEGSISKSAEAALKMIQRKMSDEEITYITSLSREEVNLLRNLYNQHKETAVEYIEIQDGKIILRKD